jgi:hypothetical protein
MAEFSLPVHEIDFHVNKFPLPDSEKTWLAK